MNIRVETDSDSNKIETLIYRAFENHPHHKPGAKPTEHLIVSKLREAKALTLSLVCEDKTSVVGPPFAQKFKITDPCCTHLQVVM